MATKEAEVETTKEEVEMENKMQRRKATELIAKLEEERKVRVNTNKLKEEVEDWKSKCKIELEQNEELKNKMQHYDNFFAFLTQSLDKQRKE